MCAIDGGRALRRIILVVWRDCTKSQTGIQIVSRGRERIEIKEQEKGSEKNSVPSTMHKAQQHTNTEECIWHAVAIMPPLISRVCERMLFALKATHTASHIYIYMNIIMNCLTSRA